MAAKKNRPVLPLVLTFVLVVGLAGGYLYFNRDRYLPKTEQRQVASGQWTKENGSYKTVWEYTTGGGSKGTVGFVVSLQGDIIASAGIDILTTNETSKNFQSDFKAALPTTVVGKKLADIANIDVIGGASGTTENFRKAIAALQTQLGY